jgi:hypothetical protein
MDFAPLHTQAVKTIVTKVGLLVLEALDGFPRGESNLYCLGGSGVLVWAAEKPDPNTLYSRVRLNDDETISAYTVSGHSCELNLKNGKIFQAIKIL